MIAVKSYNLDAISYLPLYSPIHAYRVEIVNTSAVLMTLRSTIGDSATSIQIFPGESRIFESTKNVAIYDPAQVLLYAILASGTGVAKVIAH